MTEQLKTGTTTVGIICKDGIVLAADKRGTAGNFIADKDVVKIEKISENFAVTIAGDVAPIQRLTRLIRAQVNLEELRRGKPMKTKEAANMLSHHTYSSVRQPWPGIAHFLFAGVDDTGFQLYDIFPGGSIMQKRTYMTSGSGTMYALAVIESNYKEGISVAEGIKLATKAINQAIKRDNASGEGINILTITKDGAKHVKTETITTELTL